MINNEKVLKENYKKLLSKHFTKLRNKKINIKHGQTKKSDIIIFNLGKYKCIFLIYVF